MSRVHDYLEATRHPWASLAFIAPLLAAYEIGVMLAPIASPDQLRNGADCWLRGTLLQFGVPALYGAPLALLAILLCWCLCNHRDRPHDLMTVWIGMALESVLYAAGLYGIARGLGPLLISLQIEPSAAQVLSYLGAGLYEETLFRLILLSLFAWIFARAEWGDAFTYISAAICSALLFAAAHHWGPFGEPWSTPVFLFRAVAGLYFAAIYQMRGFGIAVGAHTGYDLLVGIFIAR